MLKAISLFSGIGSFELAARLIFGDRYQTFQFVEIDSNAQKVLRSHFPNIPIWSDIRNYHPPAPGKSGFPTVIVGGFPCTDTSSAGGRKGLAGSESGLWWEMYRIILESGADFVVIENPEGIIHRGLRTIIGALRMAGYQTEIEIISASELGAPHQRKRVFLIAYTNHLSLQQRKGWCGWSEQIGTHIESARQIRYDNETQPQVLPVDDGISSHLARLSYSGLWKQNVPIEIGIERRTSGRRDAINLIGRSIVPLQATVVLMRLYYLCCLFR